MNFVVRSPFFLALCFFTALGCQQESSSNSQSDPGITEDETVNSKPEESASKEEVPDEKIVEGANTEEQQTAFKYINPLTEEEQAEGWLSLFDGQSLFGWESTNEEINWSVSEGNIVADSGPIGFLMTSVPFKDYELVCEYKMSADGNSGLFLRSDSPPGDIATECYEVNIAATHPEGFTTGSLVNRQKTDEPVEMKEGWNELRVTLDGDKAEVAHNGQVVLNYTAKDSIAATGRIGLQKNKSKIEFRKIILKPLNMKSLFNGKDLAGWRDVPGSKSEFIVENEEIHVSNGLGFIETEETFQDFIFQAQAISHEKELNSGYFFRAMPGTEEAPSNGYEFQIHNGFKEDRSQPNNAGTGAIFRRVDARYVVANDKEWFTSTLIANGPRIACWVDGYQVVDWLDERKADPNPRRGLRLEGGHISIQGHDPTTDLSFKNLNVSKY